MSQMQPQMGGGSGQEGLDALQVAIEVLHDLMTLLPDPKDTQTVAKCLQALTGIQQEMMMNRGPSAAQAVMQQLAGSPGGGGASAGGPGY